ncbi:NADP-dependent oxidoreductase [Rubrobacter aplysinae]|uniref:NADP-dependent oxidoreductase n=1 Tax=Rubrobacter aplysinae TaxID=909625 RepID=UPI00064BCAB9|nr:NADP-dependent oxidoreductase [Rubrobacter aplysinae]
MKAIGISRPERMQVLTLMDIPVPELDRGEALVRIQTVGVGIQDRWWIPSNARFPYAIGLEGAGIIESVGSGVTGFEPGDRVMFSSAQQPKGGTWAEFVAVPGACLISMPDALEFTDAVALPIAGTTALEGLRALELGRDGTVFMAGASGAIGTLAIQLATMRGYRVAASASAKNHEHMLWLGAGLAVDYRDPDWAKQVLQWMPEGVGAALAIQPATGVTSMQVVRDGGKVVTISGDQVSPERGITVEQMRHHPETLKELSRLAEDVAAGRVRVVIERAYPFEQGIEALQKTETRHAQGKVVLTMPDR